MPDYVLRKARFFEKLAGEKFQTDVKLCERTKNMKDYLLMPQGTFWVEIAGWKSDLFKTREEADYFFNSKCLELFINEELFKMSNTSKHDDSLRELFPFFAYLKGEFEYFHPETRDFIYYVICSDVYQGHFVNDSRMISKAIGKPISFPDLPDNLYNALIWEIKPNSANLYKTIVAEDIGRKRSYCSFTIEGDKELIYTYPNYKRLLMSCISIIMPLVYLISVIG
jgi:hypothetical protein